MAFTFGKKDTAGNVAAEVAACQKTLAELAQRRGQLLMEVGGMYLDNATPEIVGGTPYEEKLTAYRNIMAEMKSQEQSMLAAQGKRKCESCGAIVDLDSNFCKSCGAKQEPLAVIEPAPTAKKCPRCGAVLPDDAQFCAGCGAKVE